MKAILFLSLLTLSHSILANDDYVMETCSVNLPNGQTLTTQRLDDKTGYFMLGAVWGTYNDMPGYDEVKTDTKDMSLVIDIKDEDKDKDKDKKTNKDGCKMKKFDRVVEVVSASSDVKNKYGLKKGNQVQLSCTSYAFKTSHECGLNKFQYQAD